jgi:hypothetical protein
MTNSLPEKRSYVVYDPRGPDDGVVYVACESLAEAHDYVQDDFPDGVIYSYRLEEQPDGTTLGVDERREPGPGAKVKIRAVTTPDGVTHIGCVPLMDAGKRLLDPQKLVGSVMEVEIDCQDEAASPSHKKEGDE